MSTPAHETQNTPGSRAPLGQLAGRTTTLVLVAFAAVYVVWGSTYLAIRIGIESFPPLILAGFRHFFVGLFLYPVLRRKTGIKPTGANWRTAIVAGALLLFVGNGGVSWAEQTVPSGVTALLVGFAGRALLVGPAHVGGSERVNPVGAAVLVIASLAWACGSLYSKHGGK